MPGLPDQELSRMVRIFIQLVNKKMTSSFSTIIKRENVCKAFFETWLNMFTLIIDFQTAKEENVDSSSRNLLFIFFL